MPSVVRVVKADLAGDKRRFACESASFAKLIAQLAAAYDISPQDLIVTYVDDEGDRIRVANDSDLAMAWEVLEGKPLLKLHLERRSTSPTSTSQVPVPKPRLMATAIHKWDDEAGAQPGDLYFVLGERIEAVDKNKPGQGWITGKNRHGQIGVLPANHLGKPQEVVAQAPTVEEPATTVTRQAAPGGAPANPEPDRRPASDQEPEQEPEPSPAAFGGSGVVEALLAGLTSGDAAREVPHVMKTLAPLLRSEMEKLPAKLERMTQAINAAAQRPHVCRARETAATAAAAAADTAADTAHQASERAQAAANHAHAAAATAFEQATSVATAAVDFLPPAYREAVNAALEAAAEVSTGDFLPPAYRAAVDAAAAGQERSATDAQVATESTEVDKCKQQLARKFGVEPAAIELPSLTLREMQIVAQRAESLSQLQVVEAAMKARCHLGIWCDDTGAKPIRGVRFTKPAAGGDTYDLCESAWSALSKDEQDEFTRVERPDVSVLLRTSRSVIDQAGPGASAQAEQDAASDAAVPEPPAAAWDAKARALRAQGIVAVPQAEQAEQGAASDVSVPEPPAAAWDAKARALRAQGIAAVPQSRGEMQARALAGEQPNGQLDNDDDSESSQLLVSVSSNGPNPSLLDAEGIDESGSIVLASPVVDPLDRVPDAYRVQVERLIEMGYTQTIDELTQLVAANEGNLHATVMNILGQ